MIVECKNCQSTFRLDESLVKEDGSKVRCSVCRNVFLVYPPQKVGPESAQGLTPAQEEDYTETAALSSLESKGKRQPAIEEEAESSEFDSAFKELLEEDITEKAVSDLSTEEELPLEEGEEPTPEAAGVIQDKEKRKGLRPFHIVLAVVLLLLVGAGAIYYFLPDIIPDSLSFLKPASKQAINDPGTRRLTFSGVSGSFVNSNKAGQVFVIRGMVRNEYPKRRSFILVKGAILDDKGQVVRSEMAYAGNILSEKQIREMTLEQIHKVLRNRLGRGNMNVKIAPGASIPFMIILGNLPSNLSEFTVEAVRSSPGE